MLPAIRATQPEPSAMPTDRPSPPSMPRHAYASIRPPTAASFTVRRLPPAPLRHGMRYLAAPRGRLLAMLARRRCLIAGQRRHHRRKVSVFARVYHIRCRPQPPAVSVITPRPPGITGIRYVGQAKVTPAQRPRPWHAPTVSVKVVEEPSACRLFSCTA
jgi:hypothetical protein